jgi:hypothetical protein
MDGDTNPSISDLRGTIPLAVADTIPAQAFIEAARDVWMSVLLTVSGTLSICWCFYLLSRQPALLTNWMAALPGLFILLSNAIIQYKKNMRLVRCPKCDAILDTQPFTIAQRLVIPAKKTTTTTTLEP